MTSRLVRLGSCLEAVENLLAAHYRCEQLLSVPVYEASENLLSNPLFADFALLPSAL